MSKPNRAKAVKETQQLVPNLVQPGPRYFAGSSSDAFVWLRATDDGSEIVAKAIEVPVTTSSQSQKIEAVLGKWAEIAGIPTQAVIAGYQQALSQSLKQPFQLQPVPGGTLTVTKFPNTVALRVDFQ